MRLYEGERCLERVALDFELEGDWMSRDWSKAMESSVLPI